MIRLFLFFILIIFLFTNGSSIQKAMDKMESNPTIQTIQTNINQTLEDPRFEIAVQKFRDGLSQFLLDINSIFQQNKENSWKTPKLDLPAHHMFAFENVEISDNKSNVERHIGKPKRITTNEYGAKWYTYHQNYHHFLMIAYDSTGKVEGLFTNQALISSTNGIKFGSSKEAIHKLLGEPLTMLRKGLTLYKLDANQDYDVYFINDSYVTIFYDKFNKNTVTAIQVISKKMEQAKPDIYPIPSKTLEKGFEYQLFDLTNAARVKHGLHVLTWDEHVRNTALHHSEDMAVHHYFSHYDLKGQSPFVRMQHDHILFTVAGENIATGQFSSIFAHEGLMNSLGHRQNILLPEFSYLGVGVAFDQDSRPYYTEDFYK